MANLTAERATVSHPSFPSPFYGSDEAGLPIKASTKLWAGSMVAVTSANYLRKAGASGGDTVLGVANVTKDNTGADGALKCPVRQGVWKFANHGTDPIGQANLNSYCYASDDQTVRATSNSGACAAAGIVRGVDSDGVWVEFGMQGAAKPLQPSDIPAQSGAAMRTARGAVTANQANLAAFTVAGPDGVTFAEGDRILLTGQTTKSENGIWVCGAVGGGTCALSRPSDYTGTIPLSAMIVAVSEGTSFKDSLWLLTTNGSITVDTTLVDFDHIGQAPGAAAAGAVLRKAASGIAWGALDLADGDAKTGILPVANGGTASSSAETTPDRIVRGIVWTNVDVANFTLAAADLTFVEGDRVLLVLQTTGGAGVQDGIYVCGADGSGSGGAGTATLTRATDWATGSALGGARIFIRAGTWGAGKSVRCTNLATITVGVTAHTWVPEVQKFRVVLVNGMKTINAGAWISANGRFSAVRTKVSGTPGPNLIIPQAGVVAGVPGTGAFEVHVGTLADPVVDTAGDNGEIDVVYTE